MTRHMEQQKPKRLLDRITDRLLALVGLDMNFTLPASSAEQISEITDRIWLGARPTEEHLPLLQDTGITHIVSCLPEDKRADVSFLGADFQCLFLPVHDGIHEAIAPTFPEFFGFADEALEQPETKLLVHCEVGVSRSASLVIAWHMRALNMRFMDAYEAVRVQRAKILPNIGFASQLQRFEHTLFEPTSTDGEHSSLARYLRTVCNAPVDIDILQELLERYDFDAYEALMAIFDGEIPRVVQGVRL